MKGGKIATRSAGGTVINADRQGAARADRRQRRPEPVDRHGPEGQAATSRAPSNVEPGPPGRGRRRVGLRRPQHLLRHSRARHGRDHQRPGRTTAACAPFSATFLVFSDYMRPPMRLAALSELPSIFVFTHDSIGLGEDGPTHQPVEHLAGAAGDPEHGRVPPGGCQRGHRRLAGGDRAARRADRAGLHPSGAADLRSITLRRRQRRAQGRVCAGRCASGHPEVILIATGSEVGLAMDARELLEQQGRRVRVVSMPSWELFEAQPAELSRRGPAARHYRPRRRSKPRRRWAGSAGSGYRATSSALNRFGASAPDQRRLQALEFHAGLHRPARARSSKAAPARWCGSAAEHTVGRPGHVSKASEQESYLMRIAIASDHAGFSSKSCC